VKWADSDAGGDTGRLTGAQAQRESSKANSPPLPAARKSKREKERIAGISGEVFMEAQYRREKLLWEAENFS
jgi:hypothetical protein